MGIAWASRTQRICCSARRSAGAPPSPHLAILAAFDTTWGAFLFRWGIVGTGDVSQNFLLGLRAADTPAVVHGVTSRRRGQAERFAEELGVPTVAQDAASLAAADEIDALYVATPPAHHEEHALAAIRAGKPVLVEKPFASDAAAATRIVDTAREHGVFCMEGMWTRFLPAATEVRSRLAAGEIGEIRALRGDFLAANEPDAASCLFDPERGGGALRHRGVYPVSLARWPLGPVEALQATARIGETGVDEDCSLVLRHESGAISTLRASLRTRGACDLTIYGTRGTLQLEDPIYRPAGFRVTRFQPQPAEARAGGGPLAALRRSELAQGLKQRAQGLARAFGPPSGTRVAAPFEGNGFHYEADALMRAVATGARESEVMPLDESVEIMTLVDRARSSWEKGAVT